MPRSFILQCIYLFSFNAKSTVRGRMALQSLLKQFPYDLNATVFYTFLFSLISFIGTVLFVFKITRKSKYSNLNLPPSPPKLPIIGNLHQLGTLPHRSFQALSQKYGPLMFLKLGRQVPTLVVSSAEIAKEIMKTHDITFTDRPQGTAARILLYECTNISFAPYGENWRQKKKIVANELLSLRRVQSFKYIREEEVAELVHKIREVSLSSASCVNLSELLVATSYNIVCKCVLGKKYNTDGRINIGELTRKVMIQLTAFSVGDYFPSLGWVDVLTGLIPDLKATFRALDDFFDQIIEQHKKVKKGDDDRKDFVDVLLQLQEGGMLNVELTQVDLKAILVDMFVGGTDTSSITLEWAMAELVRNPMKMKKAQEEIRRVVGYKSKVDEYDINQMNYLKCVIKEILRLYPPAPLVAPRVARSSVKLDGYTIPAKTMVYINGWAIQRDPEIWERPEEFLPERFENSEVDFKGQDFRFIPFGSGRRRCPGMVFGIASVEYVLANLLYWFDWKPPRGISVEDIDMSETFGLTVGKKVPLHLQPVPFSFESKF